MVIHDYPCKGQDWFSHQNARLSLQTTTPVLPALWVVFSTNLTGKILIPVSSALSQMANTWATYTYPRVFDIIFWQQDCRPSPWAVVNTDATSTTAISLPLCEDALNQAFVPWRSRIVNINTTNQERVVKGGTAPSKDNPSDSYSCISV